MRDLAVRQVHPHEIRAQYPGRDWLMMSGKNGSRQIIEAILAGLAQVSLSVPLAIVMAIADHSCAAAVEADNAVRPAELTNDFIALRLVEQVRQLDQVHHGSRSLPHRERPTDQLPDQDQHPEILPRAGGSLPARSPSPRNPTRAINAAPADVQHLGLSGDWQIMRAVDHRFALDKPALPSAPAKKSFSSVSSPILACSTVRSTAGP